MLNFSEIQIEILDDPKGKYKIPVRQTRPKIPFQQCQSCNLLKDKKCTAFDSHQVLLLAFLYTLAEHGRCYMYEDENTFTKNDPIDRPDFFETERSSIRFLYKDKRIYC